MGSFLGFFSAIDASVLVAAVGIISCTSIILILRLASRAGDMAASKVEQSNAEIAARRERNAQRRRVAVRKAEVWAGEDAWRVRQRAAMSGRSVSSYTSDLRTRSKSGRLQAQTWVQLRDSMLMKGIGFLDAIDGVIRLDERRSERAEKRYDRRGLRDERRDERAERRETVRSWLDRDDESGGRRADSISIDFD